MIGVQDLTLRMIKTIGREIGFNKKSPKSVEHFRIKIILWFNKQVLEIRPKLFNTELAAMSFISQEIGLPWDDSHTKAFEALKRQIVNITENNHFDIKRKSSL